MDRELASDQANLANLWPEHSQTTVRSAIKIPRAKTAEIPICVQSIRGPGGRGVRN